MGSTLNAQTGCLVNAQQVEPNWAKRKGKGKGMRPKRGITNPSPSQHLAHCIPTYHLRYAKAYKLITRFIPNQCETQSTG